MSSSLVDSIIGSGHMYKGNFFLVAAKTSESELHERQLDSVSIVF
jgi:hypothetical protein